jgi:tetratricopeptide (TPR) repeat protein
VVFWSPTDLFSWLHKLRHAAGRFEESVPYYRKQLKTSVKLVAVDPKNMVFRQGLVAAHATYGHALWRAGQIREGLASLGHGLEQIAADKQTDSGTKGLETTIRLWMAGGMEKSGDVKGALRLYEVALTNYSDICRSDPKDVGDCIMVAGVLDRVARIHFPVEPFLHKRVRRFSRVLFQCSTR